MVRVPRPPDSTWVEYYVHRRRVCKRKWHHYQLPMWSSTAYRRYFSWAGHAARTGGWTATSLDWRDSYWWRATQQRFLPGRGHPMRHEGRGVRTIHWDSLLVQATAWYLTRHGRPPDEYRWQDLAQDREVWSELIDEALLHLVPR
eukprot:5754055-Amphidinium_carterae.1